MSVRTWQPVIAKNVEEFCKLDMKSETEWVISALNTLSADVCALQHEYQVIHDQQTCQWALIRLGNKLLDDFVTVEGKHPEFRIEKACHQFLASILERGEFSIEGLGLDVLASEVTATAREIARAFRRLLIRTEKYVCKKLQKTSKFDTSTIHFCVQVLALCYFYLPQTREPLLSSCSVAPGLAMQRCAPVEPAEPDTSSSVTSPQVAGEDLADHELPLPAPSPDANTTVSFFGSGPLQTSKPSSSPSSATSSSSSVPDSSSVVNHTRNASPLSARRSNRQISPESARKNTSNSFENEILPALGGSEEDESPALFESLHEPLSSNRASNSGVPKDPDSASGLHASEQKKFDHTASVLNKSKRLVLAAVEDIPKDHFQESAVHAKRKLPLPLAVSDGVGQAELDHAKQFDSPDDLPRLHMVQPKRNRRSPTPEKRELAPEKSDLIPIPLLGVVGASPVRSVARSENGETEYKTELEVPEKTEPFSSPQRKSSSSQRFRQSAPSSPLDLSLRSHANSVASQSMTRLDRFQPPRTRRRTHSLIRIDTEAAPDHHALPVKASTPTPEQRSLGFDGEAGSKELKPENVVRASWGGSKRGSRTSTPRNSQSFAFTSNARGTSKENNSRQSSTVRNSVRLSPVSRSRSRSHKQTPQRKSISHSLLRSDSSTLLTTPLDRESTPEGLSPGGPTVFHFSRHESPTPSQTNWSARREQGSNRSLVALSEGPSERNSDAYPTSVSERSSVNSHPALSVMGSDGELVFNGPLRVNPDLEHLVSSLVSYSAPPSTRERKKPALSDEDLGLGDKSVLSRSTSSMDALARELDAQGYGSNFHSTSSLPPLPEDAFPDSASGASVSDKAGAVHSSTSMPHSPAHSPYKASTSPQSSVSSSAPSLAPPRSFSEPGHPVSRNSNSSPLLPTTSLPPSQLQSCDSSARGRSQRPDIILLERNASAEDLKKEEAKDAVGVSADREFDEDEPESPDKVSFFVDPGKPWQKRMMQALRRLGRSRTRADNDEAALFRETHRSLFCWGEWFDAKIDLNQLKRSKDYRAKDWSPSLEFRFLSAFQVFEFLRLLLETVLRVVGSQYEVVWDAIPGYWTLFELIVERSMILSTKMDAPLLACYSTMALNVHGVGFLTQVLLHGTRLNEGAPHPVLQTLDRISHWIRLASPPGEVLDTPLPDSFCWDTLYEAWKRCLQSKHHLVLLAVMVFMYVHAGNFQGFQRRRFFSLLVSPEVFNQMFDHWHWQTRRIYMHWLAYRRLRQGIISDLQAQEAREAIMDRPGCCGLRAFASKKDLEESVVMTRKLPAFVKVHLLVDEEELETDRLLEAALQSNLARIRQKIKQHASRLAEAHEKDKKLRRVDWSWDQPPSSNKQSTSSASVHGSLILSSEGKGVRVYGGAAGVVATDGTTLAKPPLPRRSAYLFPTEQTGIYGEEALEQFAALTAEMEEAQRIAAPFLGLGLIVFPREVAVPPRQHQHVIQQALLGSLSGKNPYRLTRKERMERRERTRSFVYAEERVVFDEVDEEVERQEQASMEQTPPSMSRTQLSGGTSTEHSNSSVQQNSVISNGSLRSASDNYGQHNGSRSSYDDAGPPTPLGMSIPDDSSGPQLYHDTPRPDQLHMFIAQNT
eukprot:gb/GEZN01000279.1/.p1 GENE.gb/GEZN01000279.1/~~gb/GEZN01000279.1/.p1  ORF type:complete len:1621 (-),score=244.51 gb/GEZN01000279.1/:8-4870(-)